MLIRIGYDIELGVASPMALIYMLRVHPSRRDDLVVPEALRIGNDLQAEEYIDTFGNHCGRVAVPAGTTSVRFTNLAYVRDSGQPDVVDPSAVQHDPTALPLATLQFLLPSRYCEVDSELLSFAWNRFGPIPPGWQRVQAICDFVHQHLTFDYQAARPTRTALEGFRERVGVCRDFTHLAVTLCRCMNIPARYTTGYLGDIGVPPVPSPMDFSAWFEAYLGDRWYTFDARHNVPRIGRVVIGRGRDAVDVALATQYGNSRLTAMTVWSDEVTDGAPHDADADELEAAESR